MAWCRPRATQVCPAGLPELSHALNHPGDELASQFDQILNLSGIFAPLLPLDSALTFWAPLDYTLNDLLGAIASFGRGTAATWRRDDGEYFLVPSNQPRFEQGQLLMEPAITNKCENYNANPDADLTNVLDGGGTKSRVANAADIASAKIGNICTDGNVIQIENTTGANIFPTITGAVGNLNTHTASVWVNGFGADFQFGIGGNRSFFNTSTLEKISYTTPGTSTASSIQFRISPGEKIQFVLNQLEELAVASSPIITQGAAASRDIDKLTYAAADQFFNQAQGMALITMRPRFDKGQNSGVEGLLTVNSASLANVLYYDTAFRSNDGTNTAAVATPAYVDRDLMHIAATWGPAGPGALNVGYRLNDNPWVWPDAIAYDGAYLTDDILAIVATCGIPVQVSDVRLYGENRGEAWIEDNYP